MTGWFSARRSPDFGVAARVLGYLRAGALSETALPLGAALLVGTDAPPVSLSAPVPLSPQQWPVPPIPPATRPGALSTHVNDDAPPNGLQAGRGVTYLKGV